MNQLLHFLSKNTRWDGQYAASETSSSLNEGKGASTSIVSSPLADIVEDGDRSETDDEVRPIVDGNGAEIENQDAIPEIDELAVIGSDDASSVSPSPMPFEILPSPSPPIWTVECVYLQEAAGILRGSLSFSVSPVPTISFSSTFTSHRNVKFEKSGFLKKRTGHLRQYTTYWFVLKNSTLQFYDSPTNIYYPVHGISLRNILTITRSKIRPFGFKILTANKRKYHFQADTQISMEEWITILNENLIQVRHTDFIINLPLSFVSAIDVVNCGQLDNCLRIVATRDQGQEEESEFFFAYLQDVRMVLESLVTTKNAYADTSNALPRSLSSSSANHRLKVPKTDSGIKSEEQVLSIKTSPSKSSVISRDVMEGAVFHGDIFAAAPGNATLVSDSIPPQKPRDPRTRSQSYFIVRRPSERSSQPSPASSPQDSPNLNNSSRASSRTSSSSWLWGHRKSASVSSPQTANLGNERALTCPSPEIASASVSPTKNEHYRDKFFLGDEESLIASFPSYFLKYIPRNGKLYLSTSTLCFRSRIVGVQTLLVVPLSDIVFIESNPTKSSSLYYGLMILTAALEEMWFEFYSSEARQEFVDLLQRQIELVQGQQLERESHSRVSDLPPLQAASSIERIHESDSRFKANKRVPLTVVRQNSVVAVGSPLVGGGDVYLKKKGSLNIVCLTVGSRGDVQPYISLCLGLMKDGHSCTIATHSEFEKWIVGYGIKFKELKGNPAELMSLCVDNGMFSISFLRESYGRFRGWIEELLTCCWDACQGADLLIESPTAMGGLHCAEALDIPYFSAFPMPWTRTKYYPHPFAVPDRHMGYGYNYMTHVLIEQTFCKGINGLVNRFRKTVLNRPPISLLSMNDYKIPCLYSFSPKVVPPPADWPDWIHTCGYWFLDNSEHNWTPPEDLAKFLEAGTKPVYIGFGSIVVQDPDEMTRVVIDACVKANVRAVISKGWSARHSAGAKQDSQSIEIPSTIYYLTQGIPHRWLFPRMSGVVHHGGAGTTSEGLRAGVPTVIKPYFGDQSFWAERVVDLGVGLALKKLSVEKLSSALVTITTDKRMAQAAQQLAYQITEEDGVGVAIHNLYRDLDFALERVRKVRESVDASAQSWLG